MFQHARPVNESADSVILIHMCRIWFGVLNDQHRFGPLMVQKPSLNTPPWHSPGAISKSATKGISLRVLHSFKAFVYRRSPKSFFILIVKHILFSKWEATARKGLRGCGCFYCVRSRWAPSPPPPSKRDQQ